MEILQQLTFIERGIVAGLIIGLICPLLGAFLLVRRITIITEALSHITLTGITAGVFISQTMTWLAFINPLYTGLIFSLVGSILIEKLRHAYKSFQELAVPIILSSGIGLSAILIGLSSGSTVEWYSYLFGSLVTVSLSDLYFTMATGFIAFIIIFAFYKEWLSISFDQEFAKTSGIKVNRLNFFFSLLIALVISMSMKVVGILLVGAMVTLPVAASIQIAKSFRQVVILGIIFGEVAMIAGILFSYYFNIATGGMVVVTGVVILLLTSLIKRLGLVSSTVA
ncbi:MULTISPECIES: metal ABC transporter permease [Bacillaceae]|uniref:Metal ABC transporter permease n=1 Tax=Evansella alkalicola TaxID=745819 RepID=A0ABS6JW64_9BACI|nr:MULTISPECIES: metal ABC transporter permease [Bacillaceae]MBU9722467.1 metal ABC transporter permease [Bacillus alkalicola]